MTGTNSEADWLQRIRIAFRLTPVALMVATMYVVAVAPVSIFRDEADRPLDYLAGVVGMMFWAVAAAMLLGEI
ncbi:hypothetical protein [Halomicrobium urmianum]|uniref:hypothetical protein n=1 Tax=Halomicrobium urmianum TaxID=1586233 RepID=UPI001CDA0DAF|nr:hypothetical protein [Halomicrobium urmianum]